jgi:hypothetical protein
MSNNMREIYKRLGRENYKLINRHQSVSYRNSDDGEHIFITIITRAKITYIFTISNKLPFEPPIATINGYSYANFIKVIPKFREILLKLTHRECLCCSSALLCNKKYKAATTLWKLVDECDRVYSIKRILYQIYYANLIAETYITHDIPLEDYLYDNAKSGGI